jgi:hypothetical protein
MAKLSGCEQWRSAAVLTEAVVRAASFWDLSDHQLATMLGVPAAAVCQLREGAFELELGSQAFVAGQYLVRLFNALDALMGSDDQAARDWLRSPNLDLGEAPIDLLTKSRGLSRVCDYVDAFRARVFPSTQTQDVFRSLPFEGNSKTIEDMTAAVAAEARRRARD